MPPASQAGRVLISKTQVINCPLVARVRIIMRIKSLRKLVTSLCALSLLAQFTFAQTPTKPPVKPFELTVDSIMRGPRLVGYQPSGVYWSQDSQRVYFRWKQANEPRLKEMSLYVINRDGTGLRRLSDEE